MRVSGYIINPKTMFKQFIDYALFGPQKKGKAGKHRKTTGTMWISWDFWLFEDIFLMSWDVGYAFPYKHPR